MSSVPLILPVRAADAIALADIIFDAAERRPFRDDVRNRIAARLNAERFDRLTPHPGSLAEDPVLHSADYRNHRMMAQSLHAAEVAKKRDQIELAIEEAQRAVSLSPLSADAQQLLADLLWSRAMQSRNPSHRQQATQSYSTFLKLSPPHRVDVEQAEQRLKQLAASAP